MSRHKSLIKTYCICLALAGHAIRAAAQTADQPAPPALAAPSPSAPANSNPPTAAEVAAEPPDRNGEEQEGEPVRLSPFSVNGESDTGYQAQQTMAATRLRTNLDDVGSALQVVTKQFIEDTGATGNQSLLIYTTGTEVGGLNGNFEGNGNGSTVYEQFGSLQRPDLNTRIRGLSAADNTRDLETSDIPWDSYNIDTVEIQRGANSILFGEGSPAGLVNASLKEAAFENSGTLESRFGSYGSWRDSLDVNRVLLKDELAVRVDVVKDQEYYEEKPAYSDDKRVFGALRYDPKFLNKGSAHTSLRVNFEHGGVDADNPRTLPPEDEITPWFKTGTTTVNGATYNNLNQGTYNFNYNTSYFANVPGSGAQVAGSPNY